MTTRISRFGETPETELPADIREEYERQRQKAGFVPNVFRAYGRRPEHFRAFMRYVELLKTGDGGLTRAEREAIIVVVSAENKCQYCSASHGAALRIFSEDPVLADQIAINWRTASLSSRWYAMLRFASRINEPGFTPDDEEIEALRHEGFSDEDIWDIASIAAFFGFSNRMAGVMDLRPNSEFYAMGRASASSGERS